MKRKYGFMIILIAISLALTSCSSNNEIVVDNNSKNEVKKSNGENIGEEESDMAENLIFNSDGSDTTIKDLERYAGKGPNGEVVMFGDSRFKSYGILDSEKYDGISIEEIIKRTLDQANRKDNYTIQFKGHEELTIEGVKKFSNNFSTFHEQDSNGKFRVSYEQVNRDTRNQKIGITTYNGEEYKCMELSDTNNENYVDSLPPGLTGSEVWELLIRYNYNNSEKDKIIKGRDLQELEFDYDYIIEPAIKDSLFYLDMFMEGLGGSFVRFKDGFKIPYKNELFNDNVYHIAFIKRTEDPELSQNFEFFIDKETYLITFQYGEHMGFNYDSKIEYYSTEHDNSKIDFNSVE